MYLINSNGSEQVTHVCVYTDRKIQKKEYDIAKVALC